MDAETKRIIGIALQQHAEHGDIGGYLWGYLWIEKYAYPLELWFWRWFYTMKAILCLLLDLGGGCYGNPDSVEVASFDEYSPAHYEYGGSGWTTLATGRGLFSNWFYEIYDDSSV